MDVEKIRHIFPKTSELLDEARARHLKEHFQFAAKKDLLVLTDKDQSRWFPVFLKLQGVMQKILEVAEFEYIQHSVRSSEMGEPLLEPGLVKINPSVQFVELHHDQPKLGRLVGLYCFFKKSGAFYELQLALPQALILDLLQEGRKFTLQQLGAMAGEYKIGPQKSQNEWQEIIAHMIQIGLLVSI